jgi:hypothetical protein
MLRVLVREGVRFRRGEMDATLRHVRRLAAKSGRSGSRSGRSETSVRGRPTGSNRLRAAGGLLRLVAAKQTAAVRDLRARKAAQ